MLKKEQSKRENCHGQSLIEVVFVIFISALLLSGLAAGTTFMLAASGFARQRTTAVQIAKRELENLQADKLEQQWWDSLLPYCQGENNCQVESCPDNPRFSCQTCFSNCNLSGEKKAVEVSVGVSWGKRGKVKMSTVLSNWQ